MTLEAVFVLDCLDDECKGQAFARFPGGCGFRVNDVIPYRCPLCCRDRMKVIKRPPIIVTSLPTPGFDKLPTT